MYIVIHAYQTNRNLMPQLYGTVYRTVYNTDGKFIDLLLLESFFHQGHEDFWYKHRLSCFEWCNALTIGDSHCVYLVHFEYQHRSL